uniref:NADH-ubiquinone oxidoreductase chain 5 n=1 Tax=Macrocheles glaber TaxID=99226 RepID=A0A6B9WG44_9ACAR|nr:NADH dehydrogenase subunit 5 [Macrocheles glaber]QHQ98516.1 NADH dehydrogenase subunit 5 [Macrocheles glaber]
MTMLYKSWSLVIFMSALFCSFFSIWFLMYNNYIIFEYNLTSFFICDINFFFYFDWMSLLFLSVVLYISSMVVLYSACYMREESMKKIFLILVLSFILSMLLLIVCLNVLTILIGWDGLGLVSYCLVAYYQNESSQVASLLTVMTNRIGDVGMLMAIIFMSSCGSWGILEYGYLKNMNIIIIMLMLAALTKSAQMPFSAWLPAAMAAPTPVSALVHSSTLVTAGVYLMLRFFFFFEWSLFSKSLFYISLMTTLMAGIVAAFEMDLKKVIAMSTLSQLGTMFLVVSVGEFILGFFHLLSHAVIKAMLFLAAGVAIHSSGGYQDMRKLVCLSSVSPVVSSCMAVGCLSLSGFPFTSGFYSKDALLEFLYSLHFNMWIGSLIFLTIIFTVVYSFRICFFSILMSGGTFSYYYCVIDSEFVVSIFMLCFVSIFFGASMSWGCFVTMYSFYLTWGWKMVNNLILIVPVLMMCFYSVVFLSKSNVFVKQLEFFFANMWYIPCVNLMALKLVSKMSNYYKVVDNCWVEELSSMGLYKYFHTSGKILFFMQQFKMMTLVFYTFLLFLFFVIL